MGMSKTGARSDITVKGGLFYCEGDPKGYATRELAAAANPTGDEPSASGDISREDMAPTSAGPSADATGGDDSDDDTADDDAGGQDDSEDDTSDDDSDDGTDGGSAIG